MTLGECVKGGLVSQEPVADSIAALTSSLENGQPLPMPVYTMLFPIVRAVLSWPQPSVLHEQAIAAVALHVSPGLEGLPITATLALLYSVLDSMHSYRFATLCTPLHASCPLCS